MTVLLIKTGIPGFITELEHILYNDDIDVVLGDFNINYMNSDDCNPLKSMMKSLILVVKEPTFISSGTELDHIYLKSSNNTIIYFRKENNKCTCPAHCTV